MGGGCLFFLKTIWGGGRHAAPRNQHTRIRVSARLLREIDSRLGVLNGRIGAERIWHAHTCTTYMAACIMQQAAVEKKVETVVF